jgi:hypothetical protein
VGKGNAYRAWMGVPEGKRAYNTHIHTYIHTVEQTFDAGRISYELTEKLYFVCTGKA